MEEGRFRFLPSFGDPFHFVTPRVCLTVSVNLGRSASSHCSAFCPVLAQCWTSGDSLTSPIVRIKHFAHSPFTGSVSIRDELSGADVSLGEGIRWSTIVISSRGQAGDIPFNQYLMPSVDAIQFLDSGCFQRVIPMSRWSGVPVTGLLRSRSRWVVPGAVRGVFLQALRCETGIAVLKWFCTSTVSSALRSGECVSGVFYGRYCRFVLGLRNPCTQWALARSRRVQINCRVLR